MGRIRERHEIVVHSDEATFVFHADDEKLTIRKEGKDECALTLANRRELHDFLEGLQRVLARPAEEPQRPQPHTEQRREVIESARRRNAKAFVQWTRAEEDELRRRHASGESLDDIARAHDRSQHAIEMRLRRLGLIEDEDARH